MTTHPARAHRAGTAAQAGRPAIGLLLTAVMLFPVYWMINVSFTRDQDMRKSPPDLFPVNGTLDGYRAVLDQQLPVPGHQPARRARHRRADRWRCPRPPGTRWPSCGRAAAAAVSFVLLIAQMIPGIIMAMGFYAIYLNLGMHQHRLRA